ncbi:MRC1-like domain-containing protein [Talaromyces proteolyticus]|uniref:MRC1-like domain-containing protein n=1 Tax=Talaromyces proteolyticus TaxID=1131652 RepID=A0AAD4Q4M9_9EURO|nr:MRC1-like domain-containing protein [Talaromyces proteolyticus]KAH8703279.1 MRC1-like domain-containing protein [Talaromyces proteolyticus]
MSSPSTPRRRSESPDHEAADSPATMLTPGQKIKAMLAEFDSDSESENVLSTVNEPLQPVHSKLSSHTLTTNYNDDDEDDDEDAVVFAPRGRMASRMQGLENEQAKPTASKQAETAYERVARTLRATSEDSVSENANKSTEEQPSGDDLPSTSFKKRLFNKKTSELHATTTKQDSARPRRDRSETPLFVGDESEPELGNAEEPEAKKIEESKNARFLALIQQKRKEREERERIEAEKKAARAEKAKQFSSDVLSRENSDDDPESARKLTQQARPTRKASKKALEEMNRETQRMSRNMQLTHQARTKRKLTKESFLARFNGDQQKGASLENITDRGLPTISSSSAPSSSDGEANREKATPPTSPIRTEDNDKTTATTHDVGNIDTEFSTIEESRSQVNPDNLQDTVTVQQIELLESVAPSELVVEKTEAARKELNKPPVRVRVSRQEIAQHQQEASDDELEVITSPGRCRKLAAFENLPSRNAQESKSMLTLKLLAHLTSPTRTKSMSPAELGASLRLQARQQALQERRERIEELRARGIFIETAEEREAMEADVEDLVEKARQEGEEIARREKAARGKNSNGDENDEEDDDYILSDSEDEEDEEEEEEEVNNDSDDEEGDEDEEQVEQVNETNGLVENEADEASESDDEQSKVASLVDKDEAATQRKRGRNRMRIVSDDEDEDEDIQQPQEIKTPAKSIAPSVGSAQRPYFPDIPGTSSFDMSLTQAFAGTLAEDQSDAGEDSLDAIRSLPDPRLSATQNFTLALDSQVMVKDSQELHHEVIDLFAGYTQSDMRISESPAPSQFPEPTQDAGFVLSPFDPSKRFMEPPVSTIDTVIIPQNESPVMRKRRLQRGRPVELSDDENDSFEIKASAFDVMKKAAKSKSTVPFDKINSKAKEHVDDAAEESEDEYAGLGGASDDEDGAENDYDREMINDQSGEVVDEKELAALNANHQRAMDEKQVSKLLKDITTGALRRRRGGDDDLDLDDSDDERMARRRAKQREFAKMRQALLADEKVNEIANNPKKQAFFKALEDHDDGDDMEIEFDNGVNSQGESSQDVQPETESAKAETSNQSKKRKRPLQPSAEETTNRPPPNLRRTAASVSRKPSSLAEIRETLSFLTETPEYDSFKEDASVEEEIVYNTDKETSEDENMVSERRKSVDGFAIPPNPRRTRGRVVDRIALLRAASSNSASTITKSAFMTNSSADGLPKVGFRPPPLLRRSTTASSSASASSSSSASSSRKTSTANSAASGTKKGAVNYYAAARERERERELRVKERGGASNTAALLKKRALAGGLGSLTRNQWG